MKNLLGIFAAACGAAATMYYFDPDMGRRRRAMLRQSLTGAAHDAQDSAVGQAQYAIDRAKGALAAMAQEPPRDDAHLRERVMSRLGRLVSHPRAIDVQVEGGAVRLSGDVLAGELDGMLTQIRDMSGVKRVVNAMSVHETPQGMTQRRPEPSASADDSEDEARAHPT